MLLKIVFSIFVIIHLKGYFAQGCVTCGDDEYYDYEGYDYYDDEDVNDVGHCFYIFSKYSEEANVFLEIDATDNELEQAKQSIIKQFIQNYPGIQEDRWGFKMLENCFEKVKKKYEF